MTRVRRMQQFEPEVQVDENGTQFVVDEDGDPWVLGDDGQWALTEFEDTDDFGYEEEPDYVTRAELEQSMNGADHDALLAYFRSAFEDYEEETGRQLSGPEMRRVAQLALENPDENGAPDVFGVLVAHDQMSTDGEAQGWDASFEAGRQRLEQDLGRKLTEKEVAQLRDELPQVTEGELDVKAAWEHGPGRDGGGFDLDTQDGRTRWATQRLIDARQRENPPPETVAPLPADATNEQAAEWAAARMNGAEVVDPGEGGSRAEQPEAA